MTENKQSYQQLETDWKTLRRRYLANILATQKLEKEVLEHRKYSEFCKQQLINADENVAIQKKITMDNIMQSQATHDNLVKEILELKAEIKRLKNGN